MSTQRKEGYILGTTGLAVAALFVLVATAFVIYKVYRMYNPYLDREISGAVTLDSDWLQIDFNEPIYPERVQNEISIDFEETYPKREARLGLILEDGRVLSPRIELLGVDGSVVLLNEVVATGPRGISRGARDPETFTETLPRLPYRAIRIRSDVKANVERIYWRSYDPADFK